MFVYSPFKRIFTGRPNRLLPFLLLTVLLLWPPAAIAADSLDTPYTDATQLTNLTWPYRSHWLQPWRAYLETMPATTFLNGIGVNLGNENPALVAQMVAKYGVRNARIEIVWGAVDYTDETKIVPWVLPTLVAKLQACKQWGIRPLILLNSHQGTPTPFLTFQRTVTASAPQGATRLQLDDTSNLVLGHSGLSHLTDYWAAEALITAINGNTVTLSKPLPEAINAGTVVKMATLKYRPFSTPGSAAYTQTLTAWQRYVNTVATFVADTLGTTNSSDKGFDLEIWNELTFGTHFLYLNDYYTSPPYDHPADPIWGALVQATADTVNATPSRFQGVTLVDGFSNTMPWRAADLEPARVGALSKHPYQTRIDYGSADGEWLNALGQPDTYQPTYTARFFPEYFGTALRADTYIRDMAPITTRYVDIFGEDHAHGRNARRINNQIAPVSAWITEVGIAPREDGITDRQQALALKNKVMARYLAFYLNKGVNKLFIYNTSGNEDENGHRDSDLDFGLLQQNFIDYIQNNNVYPADDRPYVAPALQTIGRMVSKMKEGLDPTLTTTRPLRIDAIRDNHNHAQFIGDNTAAHPTLFDRDLFAFLPFQVNAHRFVIPYYVMTRDLTTALGEENFTLQLAGVDGLNATVTVYDPLQDRTIPVTVNGRSATTLTLTLTASDAPYLLLLDDQSSTTGTGLQGRYYDNRNFTNLKVTRVDSSLNFSWNAAAPHPSMGADTFSVRWSGFVQPRYSELYTFYTSSDDGVRLWVNGRLLINNWTDHAVAEDTGTIQLVAGRRYAIRLDFYDKLEDAILRLSWSSRTQSKQIIPQAHFFPPLLAAAGLNAEQTALPVSNETMNAEDEPEPAAIVDESAELPNPQDNAALTTQLFLPLIAQ